jgi:hypothetical protein
MNAADSAEWTNERRYAIKRALAAEDYAVAALLADLAVAQATCKHFANLIEALAEP